MDALRCIFLTFCSTMFVYFFALVGDISAEGGKFNPRSILMQLLQSLFPPEGEKANEDILQKSQQPL